MRKSHKFLYKRRRLKTRAIYNQADINKVMYKHSITGIISDFISLKRAGSDHAGRCSFCRIVIKNDTHFRVSERLNKYKYFECGVGGRNAISFLMRYYEIPFDEVIQFVDRTYTKTGIRPEGYRPVKQLPYNDDDLPF